MRLLFILLIISAASIVTAQEPLTISGKVTLNSQPTTATVVLKKHGKKVSETMTDSVGQFVFRDVLPGDYLLHVTTPNGLNIQREIPVTANSVSADFDLSVPLCGTRRNCSTLTENVTIAAESEQLPDEISKSVSVINGQEMRDRADITLVDSLRTIPGFRIQQLGGFGRTASIKSRGLRNHDTAVLIDGIRVRDAASITGDASAFLSDITLTSVSRVEVLRGAGSSLYGTNAAGGTINLQTPVTRDGWHGQIGGAAGGLGLGRFRGNLGYGRDDFTISGALSRTVYVKGIDGDDDAGNTNFQSRIDYFPRNRNTLLSFRFYMSDANVELNSNPDTVFGGVPSSNSRVVDAVPGVNFESDANDPDNFQKSRLINPQIFVSHAIAGTFEINGHYSFLDSRRVNENGLLGVGFQSEATSRFDGTIHTANAGFVWSLNDHSKLSGGYEFESEKFENEGSTPSGVDDFSTRGSQSSHTIFLQELASFFDRKLNLTAGVRGQIFSLKTPTFSSPNAPYQNINLENPPSAVTFDGSASYFFEATGTKFRAHLGTGYRVASLYERIGSYYNTFGLPGFVPLGDPTLEPERIFAFDAGVDQYLLNSKVQLTGTYFYSQLTDTITFDNDVRSFGRFGGYANKRGGISRGFELSTQIRPFADTDVSASYSFTNSKQAESVVGGLNLRDTFGVPKNQFTAVVTQRFKRMWVAFDFLASSDYFAPIFDTNNFSFQTYVYRFSGNRRGDLTAGYTFKLKNEMNLRLFGTVENIFDNEYFENGFKTAGISGRVGVSFNF